MRIRPAELADLEAILALDHSYATDHVWQMSGQNAAAEQNATFRLARLPRQIQAPSPYEPQMLRRCLHRCDYLWVMQAPAGQEIYGYIGMALLPWHNTGWIPAFAVTPHMRRKGIGTRLLQAAIAQARLAGLSSVTLSLPTQNYPATRFCQTRGMRFSGYADNYYAGRDIALFFTYRIK